MAAPADHDDAIGALSDGIILEEEEWVGISQAGDSSDQICDEDTQGAGDGSTDGADTGGGHPGGGNVGGDNTGDMKDSDADTEDFDMFDMEAYNDGAGDNSNGRAGDNSDGRAGNNSNNQAGYDSDDGAGDDSDNEDSEDNVGTSDLEDSKMDGGCASAPEATSCKNHLLSLVCDPCSNFGSETDTFKAKDIEYIQKQPQVRTFIHGCDCRI